MLETKTDRYLAVGAISAVISLLLMPIAGVVSIYSGYKVHGETKELYSYLLVGMGTIALLLWIGYLLTL
ncbi:hypothetical protein Hrd1104_04140 [Halorhabdus sp. CBA1104]|uniref:hypothetical protein n=1 Tax=unclassified Halorhabdus TaxID=2621901 RepID=UPI0012B26263|nr:MULTISPECIES: hypothetical protein [unclassified Halorhabdus]QGN06566.1 hypothetical protein Hrd1104_04140 [Halorhabdus sp. CBA1104]